MLRDMVVPRTRTRLPQRPDGWRVGDVVVVRPDHEVTNLGEGVVVDVLLGTERYVKQVLVRFDNGPATGVWYGTPMLTPVRDLEGRSLTPGGEYAVPTRASKAAKEAPPPRSDVPKTRPFLRVRDLLMNGLLKPEDDLAEFVDKAFDAQSRGAFRSMAGALEWARIELSKPKPDPSGFPRGARVRIVDPGIAQHGLLGTVQNDPSSGDAMVRLDRGEGTFYFSAANLERVACLVETEPVPVPELRTVPVRVLPPVPSSVPGWERGFAVGAAVRVVKKTSSLCGREGKVFGAEGPNLVVMGLEPTLLHFRPQSLELIVDELAFPGAERGFAVGVTVSVADPDSSFFGRRATVVGSNPPYVSVEGLAQNTLAFLPEELDLT